MIVITDMRLTTCEFPLNYATGNPKFITSIPLSAKILSVEKSRNSDYIGNLVLLERNDSSNLGRYRSISITPIWSGGVGPSPMFSMIEGKFIGVVTVVKQPISQPTTSTLSLPSIPVDNFGTATNPSYSTIPWNLALTNSLSSSSSFLQLENFYIFVSDPNEQEFQYGTIISNSESSRPGEVSQHVLF